MRNNLLRVAIVLISAISISNGTGARIKRDHKAVAEFKRSSPCPSTGKPRGACPGWVVDHRTALACGGSDAPANMQWQTVAEAKAKDKWERRDCKK